MTYLTALFLPYAAPFYVWTSAVVLNSNVELQRKMPQITQILTNLIQHYQKSTPRRLKLIDAYLGYVLVVGVLQFVYGVVFGTFPYNAFLAGFISTVASFVLAGTLS